MNCAAKQGIYIHANDRYIDDTIALLNSLRRHAPQYPVLLIPYDSDHQRLLSLIHARFGVEKYEPLTLFDQLESFAEAIMGWRAPMFRKLAMWSGPFDEFIYFDVDIVVLREQTDIFHLLGDHDFVYCSEGRAIGIREVFTPAVLERNLFTQEEIDELFNAGFFASRKSALNIAQIFALLKEASTDPAIFDPNTQDQPFMNYMVLRTGLKKIDLRGLAPQIPDDAWAGLSTLKVERDKVYKVCEGKLLPVRHVHWAGFKPGFPAIAHRPYVDLWLQYRYPGGFGVVQRAVVRVWWRLGLVLERLLRICTPGWYHPSFQIRRLRRLAASVLGQGRA